LTRSENFKPLSKRPTVFGDTLRPALRSARLIFKVVLRVH
jgi:hypothetical protein